MSDLIRDLAAAAAQSYRASAWAGTFDDFLREKLVPNPYQYTRTAFQYADDAIHHFGTETVVDSGETLTRYRLFDDPFFGGKKKIFGLERTIARLVSYIRASAREEGAERIFILHGPVGTAKTSLADTISRGLEHYSRTPGGEALTYDWVFPRDFRRESGSMLLSRAEAKPASAAARESILDPGPNAVVFPCDMRDNPLLLLPRAERRELLTRLVAEQNARDGTRYRVPFKLLEGEPCYNCQQIGRWLMNEYGGDLQRVLSFVRVRRFVYSEVAGTGIARVQPEGNVENSASIVSFDENYRYLGNLMNSLSLVAMRGKHVKANRGILHYSDIFKKPVQYLQHLLSACEEHKVDFGDVSADLDVMIVGTTNVDEYVNIRQDPVSKALRSRVRKIDVPYQLNHREEARIYDLALEPSRRYRHVAPHTTEVAAVWAVATRLDKPALGNNEDFTVTARGVANLLTPLTKAWLYGGDVHPSFSREQRRALTPDVRAALRNEFPLEGMSGCPTRTIQNLFADACGGSVTCVTPFAVFDGIEAIIAEGPITYEFLARDAEETFYDAQAILEQIRTEYDRAITEEIWASVVDVTPEQIDARIGGYLEGIRYVLRGEKRRDPVTGKEVADDDKRLAELERLAGVEASGTAAFRSELVALATEAVKDLKPGEKLNHRIVFADLHARLRRGLYRERSAAFRWDLLLEGLAACENEAAMAKLDPAVRGPLVVLMRNLTTLHGYCFTCAKAISTYYGAKFGTH